ncbi:hypothetical protein XFF6992_140001 [Xanthomonas citri pv. fuscans]|nr:hypothetical protein XFF6992_140001 [Xanthomonas citri pv. fuscans]SOO34103.1 hypothetical protein XFF6994_3530005 [Xanthomonas citri pv. fuscans]
MGNIADAVIDPLYAVFVLRICRQGRRLREAALGNVCYRLWQLPHHAFGIGQGSNDQRGGARPFFKAFTSTALQGFVPTRVRDAWLGSVATSRAISVPRRRSASGANAPTPPLTQQRRGGM